MNVPNITINYKIKAMYFKEVSGQNWTTDNETSKLKNGAQRFPCDAHTNYVEMSFSDSGAWSMYQHQYQYLQFEQPFLNGSFGRRRGNVVDQIHSLAFRAEHRVNVQPPVEFDLGDAFEALLEMRLHASRIFRLRQNLQQFVVGQEEESREIKSLLLQISVQAFVDQLEQIV